MFTDLVQSTERATAAGDHAWRELLEAHHTLVRRQRVYASYAAALRRPSLIAFATRWVRLRAPSLRIARLTSVWIVSSEMPRVRAASIVCCPSASSPTTSRSLLLSFGAGLGRPA